MSYNNCVGMWNDIAKYGLTKSQMPNYEVFSIPRITSFWKNMQNALSSHYKMFNVACWDINNKMSVEISDDKNHLNHKTPSDNLHLTTLIRNSQVSLVNHTISLVRCNLNLWMEYYNQKKLKIANHF